MRSKNIYVRMPRKEHSDVFFSKKMLYSCDPLNLHIAIGAVDDGSGDFFIPIHIKFDLFPLRYSTLECDGGQRFANSESPISDISNTLWDSDGGQVEAQLENPSTDTRETNVLLCSFVMP